MPAGTETALSRRNIQRVFGSPFVDGNTVTLLWKNPELFHTIFSFLEKAERFICLQFYIFRNDETGTELAEILKRKASEGIRVCLLFDHFGSMGTPRRFWDELKRAGIEVRASRPFKWAKPFHYVYRDHRKLIIIDGTIAFTGGLNIANEYRGYHRILRKEGWRDTGIFLEGPVAGALFETFRKSWEIWKGEPIGPAAGDTVSSGSGLPALPIFASSARERRKMRKLLYYSINASRHSVCLTTAYFTPSRRMLQILENAVQRGVRVRILLPGKSDIAAAHYAGRAFFAKLLKAGIEIFNYHGDILHAKTYVFDDLWSIIGSANLDFQSLRRNDEGNVGIIDSDFGQKMVAVFHEDLASSEQILLDPWLARPLQDKIKEWFFALFRRRL